MNDPLEDQFRQLRPGPLPARLRERLASPPDMENERNATGHARWWIAAAACAAVCAAFFAWPRRPAVEEEAPFASTRTERLRDARRVAVVDDGARRAWEIVELEFIDEETVVGGGGALAMQTQSVRRQFVPVELHFD